MNVKELYTCQTCSDDAPVPILRCYDCGAKVCSRCLDLHAERDVSLCESCLDAQRERDQNRETWGQEVSDYHEEVFGIPPLP